MELKSGYKKTELGMIPEDWLLPNLGSLFTFKNGLNKAKNYFGYGDPIVNYMDVYNHDGLTPCQIHGRVDVSNAELNSFRVKKGDVFFTRTSETVDEIGISSVLLEDSPNTVFSGFVLRARPKSDSLDNQFKKYCFSSAMVREQIASQSTYTTRALTNGRVLSRMVVPVPPTKAEQVAIAEALSDADAYIESLEKLIAKKRLIKQGAMQELLTGKRRLPGFSGEWTSTRIGDIAGVVMGQSPSSSAYNRSGIGLPLIQGNADIENRKTIKRVYTSDVTKMGLSGDTIMSVRAPVGAIARTHFDVCLGRGVCAIRFQNDFLYWALLSKEKQWSSLSTGSTFDSVNSSEVNAFRIPFPKVSAEQITISTILNDLEYEISRLSIKQAKARQVKQGMMQELLTGRIRLV